MKARWASVWVPALLFGGLVWAHRWVCDDGFIYLHVADNLVSGLGPVFNPGERVEAYSSPLWLALIAFFGALLRPVSPEGLAPLEWIAVGLGVACSIGAYVAAAFGADRLWHSDELPVPAGGLVVFGMVPFWDYGTSGLESSLVLLWLGLSFAGTVFIGDGQIGFIGDGQRSPGRIGGVQKRIGDGQGERMGDGQRGERVGDGQRRTLQFATAVCVGLGPLVRPDLGIFSVFWGFVVLACVPGWSRRLAVAAAAAVFPVGYQIFRMGYFASWVANTAIAKEAFVAAWARGWVYAADVETTYQLWIPLVVLGVALVLLFRRLSRARGAPAILLAAAPVAGGILEALYVTRVGGDFLHARLLLPAIFAVTLPLFTLPLRPARWVSPVLLAWGIGCLLFARVRPDLDALGIERGRLTYVAMSGNEHPVTDNQLRGMHWENATELLDQVRGIAGEHGSVPWYYGSGNDRPFHWAELRSWVSPRIEGVAYQSAIGLFGYEARQRIYICDAYGLADPYGARAELMPADTPTGRGKVGHEKGLSQVWCLAHLIEALDGRAGHSPELKEIAPAMVCGDLGELGAAVDEPLSWRRFWRNVRWATRLTRLRIPRDPPQARAKFCGAG